MSEVIVRAEVDMSSELRKAFADLGAGLAAATAAIAKVTPPTAYDMLPGGLKGATALPRHYSVPCAYEECRLPEHYVGGIAPERPAAAPKGSELARAKRAALAAVLNVLDGWIEGAQANCEGSEHHHARGVDECWRNFSPGDIRNMINDAARELGLTEFPYPSLPKEDAK